MLFLALTLLVFAAWSFVTAAVAKGPFIERLVLTGVGASGQIVVTVMGLGAAGWLTAPALSGTNVALVLALTAAVLCTAGQTAKPVRLALADLRTIGAGARAARGWETLALAAILGFAALWLATVIACYPPRGVDDLVYHLPPIYQAAQDHRLSILPLQLRNHFAFPLNGELTFLWVVLLAGSTRWVDAPQAVFAVLGIAAVYALGRQLGLAPRGAGLAAGLFGAMPVVLLQATTDYIDLIANVWLLAAAVALLRYERSGCRMALGLGGLATGLLLGSKYMMLPLALALAALAGVAVLRRESGAARRAGAAALFALPAGAACAYWYVRNWILLGNPFYPLPVRVFGRTIFPGPWEHAPSTWSVVIKDPLELLRVAAWDPGLASYHGGLGFLLGVCCSGSRLRDGTGSRRGWVAPAGPPDFAGPRPVGLRDAVRLAPHRPVARGPVRALCWRHRLRGHRAPD